MFGALLASLPLTIVWLYADIGDATKVADLAASILWLVLPSLIALPLLLRCGHASVPSRAVAIVMTAAAYGLLLAVQRRHGIEP